MLYDSVGKLFRSQRVFLLLLTFVSRYPYFDVLDGLVVVGLHHRGFPHTAKARYFDRVCGYFWLVHEACPVRAVIYRSNIANARKN